MNLPDASPAIDADEVAEHLTATGITFTRLAHPPCGTSEESYAARAHALGRPVIGAKALVVVLRRAGKERLALVVLRGPDRFAARLLRDHLRDLEPGGLKIAFATAERIAADLRGLEPGRIPPLGPPLLPAIEVVAVDRGLLAEPEVGFNAASFEESFVLATADLLRVLPQDVHLLDLAGAP